MWFRKSKPDPAAVIRALREQDITPPPGIGRVRFHACTFDGLRRATRNPIGRCETDGAFYGSSDPELVRAAHTRPDGRVGRQLREASP